MVDGPAPYQVVIGAAMNPGEVVSSVLEPGVGVVVTDSNVGPLYVQSLIQSLKQAGWRIAGVVEVPAGEGSKSLKTYSDVVRRLAQLEVLRDATLFALGGGVIGDLGGFVAHTYMRGINLVQLPTSLLAMVDSSVGGKVGVDLPEGKNLAGGFLQPAIVVADTQWLDTLPDREVSCGLAEVIKMGLLSGGDFFNHLSLLEQARMRDPGALEALIQYSVRFKAGVVAEDEREKGLRATLNYGHTVGHGIEAAAGYAMLHGEAVAVGMLAAADLSRNRFGNDLRGLHEELLSRAALPKRAPHVRTEEVLQAMARDKKRREGEHRFVLLQDIGQPVWNVKVEESEVRTVLEQFVG